MKSYVTLTGLMVSVCILAAGPAAADTTVYTVDQLRNALNAASPGDRIYVAPGNYNQRLWVQNVDGTAENMIEVVALNPSNRPVFSSDSASCITFWDCSYIVLDGVIAEHGGTATEESSWGKVKSWFKKCPLCKWRIYPWQISLSSRQGDPQHFDCVRDVLQRSHACAFSESDSAFLLRRNRK